MSASASSVRACAGAKGSWVASKTEVDGPAPLCLASKVFMTAPNSVAGFLNSLSVTAGVVSSALGLDGRAGVSMGVRIMGFTLERVLEGRLVVARQRQNLAADHFLVEIQQFAHQF